MKEIDASGRRKKAYQKECFEIIKIKLVYVGGRNEKPILR